MSTEMPRQTAASIKSGADSRREPTRCARRPRALRWLAGWLVYLPLVAAAAGDDGMLALLQGEFALQQGDHAAAAAAYVAAARASDDPAIAERASRIALLVDDPELARVAVQRWQTLAPGVPGQLALRGVLALRAGDAEGALAAIEPLLAEPDGWKQALQVLAAQQPVGVAEARVLAGLFESARWPTGLDPLLALGALAQRSGLDELALRVAERATTEFPQAARAWLWRAEAERRRENPDAARAAIDTALQLAGDDGGLRLVAASQLDALGDPAAAAAALARIEGGDDATLAARAAYLARADAAELLGELYDEIRDSDPPPTPARRYLLGQIAELREDHAAARDWYSGIEAGPMRDRATLRVAILLDRSGDQAGALQALHELQQSDSEDGEVLVDSYLLEAELLRKRERTLQALAAIERGLAVFEDEPELLYARALALERMDRVDDAVVELRRMVALDPDNADALNALGYTLADRTAHIDEASELIRRAHALKPDNPAILDSLGWVLHKLGRSNEALAHLQRSFEAQPDAEVAAHLGEVLWLLGRRDEARDAWRRGADVDPDNPVLKRTIERYGP